MNVAIITGASSGMGMEFARQIDKECLGIDELWLIARRRKPMETLAEALSSRTRIIPMDLTEDISYLQLSKILEEERPRVRLLVNAAGYGKAEYFMDTAKADVVGMIDLNCSALSQMTYLVADYMPPRSFIVQLASASAFLPQPKFAVYAATKSYVLSLARALREELKAREISVTAVCPGPVDTEFFIRSNGDDREPAAYKKAFMASKEKVVRKALKDAFRGKDVSVYGLPMQTMRLGCKLLPQGLLIAAYGKLISRPERYITLHQADEQSVAKEGWHGTVTMDE